MRLVKSRRMSRFDSIARASPVRGRSASAWRAAVAAAVLRRCLANVTAGTLLGLLVFWAGRRVLSSWLYDITPGDPRVLAARWLAVVGPQRLVWGSDWPHPTEHKRGLLPDDALLFDLLAEVVPGDGARKRVLVDNPAKLYQFG